QPANHYFRCEILINNLPGTFPNASRTIWVMEQRNNAVRSHLRIVGGHNKSVPAFVNDLRVTSCTADNARQPASHGLQHGVGQTVASRQMAKHIAHIQERKYRFYASEETEVFGKFKVREQVVQFSEMGGL